MFLHGKGPKPVHKQAAALEQARVFIERLRRKIGRGAGFGAAGFQQRRIGTQNEGQLRQFARAVRLQSRFHKRVVRDITAGQLLLHIQKFCDETGGWAGACVYV